MTTKLTDRFLTSREAPVTGRAVYSDAIIPGLAFRVNAPTKSNPEGRRDWIYVTARANRHKGRSLSVPIPQCRYPMRD